MNHLGKSGYQKLTMELLPVLIDGKLEFVEKEYRVPWDKENPFEVAADKVQYCKFEFKIVKQEDNLIIGIMVS